MAASAATPLEAAFTVPPEELADEREKVAVGGQATKEVGENSDNATGNIQEIGQDQAEAGLSENKPVESTATSVVISEKSTCSFIRIKRRADEDPASKLLLSFKRQKLVDGAETEVEEVKSVVQLAGSIHPHEDVHKFMKEFNLEGHRSSYRKKLHPRNLRHLKQLFSPRDAQLQKREEKQKETEVRRFKIVSAHRGLDTKELEDSGSGKYSMFDLIDEKPAFDKALTDDVITVNGVPMVPVMEESKIETDSPRKAEGLKTYVYDVYVLPAPITTEDDSVNVERQWDSDYFQFDHPEDYEEDHPYADEDPDSNDESNPNNDYPEDSADDEDGAEKSEDDYAAGYYDEDDDSDNAAAWVNGTKGMKELAKNMVTMNIDNDDGEEYEEEDFDY